MHATYKQCREDVDYDTIQKQSLAWTQKLSVIRKKYKNKKLKQTNASAHFVQYRFKMVRVKVVTVIRRYAQNEVNQEANYRNAFSHLWTTHFKKTWTFHLTAQHTHTIFNLLV